MNGVMLIDERRERSEMPKTSMILSSKERENHGTATCGADKLINPALSSADPWE